MRLCEICNNFIDDWKIQKHHKFSQTKQNRKIYGKLLDEPFNIMYICVDCHSSHSHIPGWANWNEYQFRNEAEKLGYKLPEGNKSFQNRNLKEVYNGL